MSIQYLAGFFDGEGSLFYKHKNHRAKPVLCMNIAQQNTEVLYKIKETYRGVYEKPYGKNHVSYWRTTDKNARNLLKRMLPYLIVKKDKVIDALQNPPQE